MRYRAIAVASERSNAVGTVELECTPHGLFVAYLGVGAFSEGYAPGALASGTGLTVPWPNVSEARVEGQQLFVAVDPKLSPLNRLLLTHFASGHAVPEEELAKRRLIIRFGAVAAALVAALILGAWLLRFSPETSAGAAIALALLSAVLLLSAGFFADQRLAAGSDDAAALASFAVELGHYLPTLLRLPKSHSPPKPLPDLSDLQGLLPRTTLAIVITLTAGTLGVLLVARWVSSNRGDVERVTTRVLESPREAAPAAAPPRAPAPPPKEEVAAQATAPAGPAAAIGAECRCARADSGLWSAPIPKLSILVLGQHVRMGKNPDESKRKRYLELEIAVINNSNKELDQIALLVLFYERDPPPSNKRSQVSNRPLFYEGPLLPGQAIKWSVEAEGTEFEIQNPISGDIGPNGEDGAPTNRLAQLIEARNRPVRLHGAMLLTYFGDPRAREAVLNLREALREDEAPYLTRLIQALADVRTCRLKLTPLTGRGSVCLFNASKETKRDLGVKVRGLEAPVARDSPTADPPTVLVETTFAVPGELAADSGRVLDFALDMAGKAPEHFEAHADRYDLLR